MSENICDPVEPADCTPPPPSHYVVTRPDGTSVTVPAADGAAIFEAAIRGDYGPLVRAAAGDGVVRLYEACNEFHMLRGGGILPFEDFRRLLLGEGQ